MVKWDDDSDKEFLMAIIHVLGAPTPDMNKVAALMGPGYTIEALRQRFYKGIKKQLTSEFGEMDGESAAAAAKTTGTKRGGKKTAGSTSGGKRKTSAAQESAGEGDGGEMEASVKKRKTKTKVKEELVENEDSREDMV